MPHKNQYGITESKKVGDILGTTITAAIGVDADQDGTVSTLEVLNSVQVAAMKVLTRTPNITELRKEATDYTEEEKDELKAEVAAATDLPKAKSDALVDRGFGLLLDLIDFAIDLQRPASDFEEVAA